MCPTCALSYAARVGIRANPSDPRHAAREGARVRPLLQPAVLLQVDVTPGRAGPHRQVGAFFRGVILIGAISKVLRLPLLQESGRLRQNSHREGSTVSPSRRGTRKLTGSSSSSGYARDYFILSLSQSEVAAGWPQSINRVHGPALSRILRIMEPPACAELR